MHWSLIKFKYGSTFGTWNHLHKNLEVATYHKWKIFYKICNVSKSNCVCLFESAKQR